ncbi:MAG: hypothetical protein HYU66_00070 [Armatimonadetes bacterium]|nr:hypothetical protein [Armatimonadota bacterium]
MHDVITRPEWDETCYQTMAGRRPVEDTDGVGEIERVELALAELQDRGYLDGVEYDRGAFDRLRAAVRRAFQVPWTSITPVMERFLYAVCAIHRPRVAVCTGIFCGNTLIWNVGPLTGPGQCVEAAEVVGCEVVAEHVELARANFARTGAPCDIRCEDAHETVLSTREPIDLLYLDASGPGDHPDPRKRGKHIYNTILEAAYGRLSERALVIAHDTVPEWFQRNHQAYFDLVRDQSRYQASVEVRIDEQGVEITRR